MQHVIGIDIGTNSVKCLLMSEGGKIVASTHAQYKPDILDGGRVEQDPQVWWLATKVALTELVRSHVKDVSSVRAIACSGQMHSSVFLDADGNVVRPAILWNDTRTTAQVEEIYKMAGGVDPLLKNVQNKAFAGFTLPKILWLRDNEPQNFKKVAKVIMPKDYINFMLTGNIATDKSDAAGTLLFDVAAGKWSDFIAQKMGLDMSILPTVLESAACVGTVRANVARELGLGDGVQSAECRVQWSDEIPPAGDLSPESCLLNPAKPASDLSPDSCLLHTISVYAGGADNSCAAIGMGVVSAGQGAVSVGTSGTVIGFLDKMAQKTSGDVHLFNYSYPGKAYAMGCMLCAGEALSFVQQKMLSGVGFDELNELAAASPVGCNNLVFLPYLYGERCPHNDPSARGVLFGLAGSTTTGEIVRSVMEGVAFGIRGMALAVSEFCRLDELCITGGGAKSDVWAQIICDVLQKPLLVLESEEGPALGAAIIAAVGCGVFYSFEQARERTFVVKKTFTPNPALAAAYDAAYARYDRIYEAVKGEF